jgi:replicative DNA helicase
MDFRMNPHINSIKPYRDINAEMAVLSALLTSPKQAYREVQYRLAPGLFSDPAHAEIFAAAVGLIETGEPVTVQTVADAVASDQSVIDAGGIIYLERLAADHPSMNATALAANRVSECWHNRRSAADGAPSVEVVGAVAHTMCKCGANNYDVATVKVALGLTELTVTVTQSGQVRMPYGVKLPDHLRIEIETRARNAALAKLVAAWGVPWNRRVQEEAWA